MGGSSLWKRRLTTAVTVGGVLLLAPTAHAQIGATLTARAARSEITFGGSTSVSGRLSVGSIPLAGRTVQLQASPYPFTSLRAAGTAVTGPDGSYSIAAAPDRNTFYRVVSSAPVAAQSAPLPVTVDERLQARVRALSLGRVRIAVSTRHPRDLAWGGRRAYWFAAEGSSARFKLVRRTRTAQGRQGLTRLSAVFPVAAGRFPVLRLLLGSQPAGTGPARRAHALPPSRLHAAPTLRRPITASDFGGRGNAPAGFPFASRIAAARRYLAGRRGYTSFAVVDSEGRASGVHVHTRFVSASVVKAMLLVAYLRKLSARHQGLDSGSRSILYPMIHVSDNNAATSVYRRVGDGGLYGLAHRVGMTDFSVSGFWANAQISAADQARFFFRIDGLVPRRFLGYARGLLAGIAGYESWGIPHIARPRWHVLFKGGWRGTGARSAGAPGGTTRAARARSLAVMTDGDPSMGYGISTIQGITAHLVGGGCRRHRVPARSARRRLTD